MVNAWNVGELDQMVLPPCHYGFQCYVRDGKYLSLMWNQRSVDTFLGLPFNIASYGLLLEIIAKEVNMVPDELIGNLGDVHLYSNHIEQAKEQITREPMKLPELQCLDEYHYLMDEELVGSIPFDEKIEKFRPDFFKVNNYQSHPTIKAPLSN
jgi:thymidylate synthase